MDAKIFIFTYGRSQCQATWRHLPTKLHQHVTLVVQHRERHLYAGYPILVLPSEIQTLPPARQWIVDTYKRSWPKKCIMMDDDLRFDVRRKDDAIKFVPAKPDDIEHMFAAVVRALDTYAHVGVCSREGGNRETTDQICARMCRILAYDVRILRKNKIRMDRTVAKEDFDTTLQLLRLGYPNIVLAAWVHGQGGSNMRGGCSTYRTIELQNAESQLLARLHPEFVKTVQKTTKTAWGGATRTDVIVQWKRAYESSQQKK